MEVKVNKEVMDYKESIFFGLSLRQFIFSTLGCVISVGIYFVLKKYIGIEAVTWACILGVVPCAALGFIRYNGMPAEKLLKAVIVSKIMTPNILIYKPQNIHKAAVELIRKEGKNEKGKKK